MKIPNWVYRNTKIINKNKRENFERKSGRFSWVKSFITFANCTLTNNCDKSRHNLLSVVVFSSAGIPPFPGLSNVIHPQLLTPVPAKKQIITETVHHFMTFQRQLPPALVPSSCITETVHHPSQLSSIINPPPPQTRNKRSHTNVHTQTHKCNKHTHMHACMHTCAHIHTHPPTPQ